MTGFHRDGSALGCDQVSLTSIAESVGTPVYVYSAQTIRARYRALDASFGAYPHALHYAMKANSTLAIVRLLKELGSAADANSIGEIDVAMRAGFSPAEIVFTGVGKTQGELERAVALGLKAINAESEGEIDRIDAIASAGRVRARVAIRINPDIDAESHPHISTGLKSNKFGIPFERARTVCREIADRPNLALVGLHIHIGSQIVTLEPIRKAAAAVTILADELKGSGIMLEHLDVGGGLGISYNGSPVPGPNEYVEALLSAIRPMGLSIIVEPGRALIGPSGALLARVVDVKPRPDGKWFVVLDAGMTELIRPAMYGAFHRIEPVEVRDGPEIAADIVGPVCETSDTVGFDRRLPRPEIGDVLAVLDAGAYGSVMASNYNRRPLPPEVLVDGGRYQVIRRRQTIDDMLANEL